MSLRSTTLVWSGLFVVVTVATCLAAARVQPDPATNPFDAAVEPATAPATQPVAPMPAGQAPAEPPAAAQTRPDSTSRSQAQTHAQSQAEPPPDAPLTPEEEAAHAALAERFAQWAKNVLAQQQITPPLMRHSAALLQAAVRESPKEPRFLRLIVEARLQLGTAADIAAARKALQQYLAVLRENRQNDVFAQIQLMDLFVQEMETAGKQMDYLRQVSGADGLPAEVRSHAALGLARVYLDRGQTKEARDAVEDAVKLNPLNAAAQQAKYRMIQHDPQVTAAQRIAVQLAMLRANPLQSDLMAAIGRELAATGLVDQAMSMYSMSFDVSRNMGLGRSLPDFTDFAALLCVAGQPRDAESAAQQILDADPGNGDAAFVKLLSERQLGDKDRIDAATAQASDALLRRMAEVHAMVNPPAEGQSPAGAADASPPAGGAGAGAGAGGAGAGGAGAGGAGAGGAGADGAAAAPATQPLEAVADYVMADVQKLKDRGDEGLYSAYVSALVRLAWHQIYFAQNPNSAAKLIDALKSLLPEGDVNVARLEGWSFIAQNKDAAGNRLSAVADRDPLSKLGLIRLDLADPSTASNAMVELAKVASENASGVTGAILVQELRDHNGKFAPGAQAADVKAEYEKFPKDFLNILTTPEKFYRLVAEPLRVAHSYGEPMLVKVTIQNNCDYDLTLGDDGVIHRDLWFDVKMSGLVQKNFSAVAYDRMGQAVVLKAKTGVARQIVRVDEGQLAALMDNYPSMAIPLLFSVFTNPTRNATGVGPGPAGQRAQFNRPMERSPLPVNQQTIPQYLNYLMAGKPADRIAVAELMATYVRLLVGQAQQAQQSGGAEGAGAGAAGAGAAGGAAAGANAAKAAEQMLQTAGQFREMLFRAGDVREGSPVFHGWIQYIDALLSPPAARDRRMEAMLQADAWEERFLGLRLLSLVPPDRQKEIGGKLAESDVEPVVRQYAASVVEMADLAPATQPAAAATQPLVTPGVPGADVSGMTLSPTPPASPPAGTGDQPPPGGR